MKNIIALTLLASALSTPALASLQVCVSPDKKLAVRIQSDGTALGKVTLIEVFSHGRLVLQDRGPFIVNICHVDGVKIRSSKLTLDGCETVNSPGTKLFNRANGELIANLADMNCVDSNGRSQ